MLFLNTSGDLFVLKFTVKLMGPLCECFFLARKQQKRFLYSDVQEHSEENGAFQLAYQAKKVKTS